MYWGVTFSYEICTGGVTFSYEIITPQYKIIIPQYKFHMKKYVLGRIFHMKYVMSQGHMKHVLESTFSMQYGFHMTPAWSARPSRLFGCCQCDGDRLGGGVVDHRTGGW